MAVSPEEVALWELCTLLFKTVKDRNKESILLTINEMHRLQF